MSGASGVPCAASRRVCTVPGWRRPVSGKAYPKVRTKALNCASLAVDNRVHDVVAHGVAGSRQFGTNAESQTVHLGLQATDLVGQTGRQHRNYPVREIDAGATLRCLTVDWAAFTDVKAHIGDVHA